MDSGERDTTRREVRVLLWVLVLIVSAVLSACVDRPTRQEQTITITDQLGRRVEVPRRLDRVTALYHFGGQILYALKQQDKVVQQVLIGQVAQALVKVDPHFAALPVTFEGRGVNMVQLEDAGIKVVAVRGETLEESFEAVRLMARILDCEDAGRAYLDDCRRLLSLVQDRLKDITAGRRRRVVFSGPKSIYTVATGEMLQTQILSLAGATNLAAGLKGFWADISPEQLASWDPDVIFVGSYQDAYGIADIYANSQFSTVRAVRNRQVHVFPSTIGWWDYPAPHCVLGVVWTAKTLYPDRFTDVDMRAIADDFYAKYMGHSFTALGGRL
jgi:iron complex transport system substrate-binding protein